MKKKMWLIVAVIVLLGVLVFCFRETILDILPIDQSGWREENGRVYYAGQKGDPLTGLVTLEGKIYFLGDDGTPTKGWVELEGKRYYFGQDGICHPGWLELEGKRYLLTNEGFAQTGWLETEEGRRYFASTGELLSSWQEIGQGRYFFDEEGLLQTGFVSWDGKTFYFDPEGIVRTGFLTLDDKTYYLDEQGAMVTGFADTERGRILLGADGLLTTGWQQWEGKSYYLDEQGLPITGWHTIDGVPCFFGEDGARHIGLMEQDGVRKYLTETGFARGILETEEGRFFFSSTGEHILLVNPWNPMPEDYEPDLVYSSEFGGYLDRSCKAALDLMLYDARKEGYDPMIVSGYRSWELQQLSHDNMVQKYINGGYSPEEALELASQIVAVPGTSEHQLGLAFDIVERTQPGLTEGQQYTETQRWLMENCWEYGFILRYPVGTTELTGIIFEPWHYRYVGKELAMELWDLGAICLEQYVMDLTQEP